ncbi:MAG: TrkA C-terminal domain-containing protein, partial [Acidimicrobiales bacterium]
QHVVGLVTVSGIVRGYEKALEANLGRLSAVAPGAEAVEARVGSGSPAAGVALRHVSLPPGTVVVTLEGPGGLTFPDGSTVIQVGDLLSAVAPAGAAAELRRLLEGGDAGSDAGEEAGAQSQLSQ